MLFLDMAETPGVGRGEGLHEGDPVLLVPEKQGVVDSPATGTGYTMTGDQITGSFNAWQCNYCKFQPTCASHGKLTNIEQVGS